MEEDGGVEAGIGHWALGKAGKWKDDFGTYCINRYLFQISKDIIVKAPYF